MVQFFIFIIFINLIFNLFEAWDAIKYFLHDNCDKLSKTQVFSYFWNSIRIYLTLNISFMFHHSPIKKKYVELLSSKVFLSI